MPRIVNVPLNPCASPVRDRNGKLLGFCERHNKGHRGNCTHLVREIPRQRIG